MHDIETCALCKCGTASHFVTTYITDNEDQIYHCFVEYGTIDYGEHGHIAFNAKDLATNKPLLLLYSKQLSVNCTI